MNFREKFSLSDKTCYILGGSGLLGLEICKAFLDFDAKVISLDQFPPLKDFKRNHIHESLFHFHELDCSNLEDIEKNFQQIISSHDLPDVFVNVSYPRTKDWKNSSFNDLKLLALKENIEINLISATWISRVVAEIMKENKVEGSIINFGSIYGVVGQNLNTYHGTKMEENAIYSVIKGALINQTRQMASVYGKHNIRVNCISPGGVEGPFAGEDQSQEEQFKMNYANQSPLSRLARAEEIGPATVFLASQASSYITGINLIIDGGWTAI